MPVPAIGKVARTITVDSIFITSFQVITQVPGSESILINYDGGYYDGEQFISVDHYTARIEGDDFLAIAGAQPDMTGGLFAALEKILFEEVVKDATQTEVPAGGVQEEPVERTA